MGLGCLSSVFQALSSCCRHLVCRYAFGKGGGQSARQQNEIALDSNDRFGLKKVAGGFAILPCRHLGLAGRRKHGCGRRPVRAPERFSRLLAAMRQKNPRDWRTCLMPRLRRESIEKLTAIRVWSVAIVHISWRANPASSAGKFLSRNQTSTIYSIANVMSHSRRRKENGQKREYLPITSPHFPTKTRPSGERPCTACGDEALPWPERRERAPLVPPSDSPVRAGVYFLGGTGLPPWAQRFVPDRAKVSPQTVGKA